MGNLVKALIRFVLAAVWWGIDKLFGTQIFDWVRGMVPAGLLPDDLLSPLLQYGPLALALIGAFWASWAWLRERPPKLNSVPQTKQEQTPGPTRQVPLPQEPPAFTRAVDISAMMVQKSRLDEEQAIHITMTVFNGNAFDILISRVQGHIFAITEKRPGAKGGKLEAPTLYNPRDMVIPAHGSVYLTIRQPIPAKLAERLRAWNPDEFLKLQLEDLNILVRPLDGSNQEARLPLWDAARVEIIDNTICTYRVWYLR